MSSTLLDREARRFPRGCVASPHHLASAAGARVLADGGNAVDAAVAANLVLAVVTPYHCGLGGDLFAIVVDGDVRAYASAGRAPAGATLEEIRAAAGSATMPTTGALPVTVPGAVAGWFTLLERHGTRPFADLARTAGELARSGFVVSAHAARPFQRSRERFADQAEWQRRFGRVAAGDRLAQPDLAAALDLLSERGPAAFYDGPIGASIVAALRAGGSGMTEDDLRAHAAIEVEPLRAPFGDLEVLELPPPTQGVTALLTLQIARRLGSADADDLRAHLHVEAARAALADREHVTDPDHMAVTPEQLLADARVAALAEAIDPDEVAPWPPARPAPGGTAYLCAADRDGRAVSLIQSNYMGFGSGVVDERFGINLQNRGASFQLDPDHPNVVAPGKRPLHTLIPGLALRDGRPWLVFGTMGGDSQPQIHLQLLERIVRGTELQAAVDAPRWTVSPADGTVTVESRLGERVVEGLRLRGHEVTVAGPFEHAMGHAHAIRLDEHGAAGATDPRAEGAVIGW